MAKAKKSAKQPYISIGIFGSEPRRVKISESTTIGAIMAKYSLSKDVTKVNGERVENDYVLQSGDTVLAIPAVKDGQ